MNLIILGPQGSGKGTQAKILAEKFGLYYFEMGGFLRDLSKSNQTVSEIVQKGRLVPDDLFFFAMKELLGDKIAGGTGMLLDGFPRTIDQYKMLQNWLAQECTKIDKVLFLDISDGEIVRRLSSRRVCGKCGALYNLVTSPKPQNPEKCDRCHGDLIQRKDDTPGVINTRLSEYRKNTLPLIDLCEKEGLLAKIDGERPISEIADELMQIVGGLNG